MKSKFNIGDKVKDSDGDIGVITDIYERDNAPNQILVKYSMLPNYMAHEFELEKVGQKAWNKGKHTGSLSEEHKEHIRQDHLGRLWVNNGIINKWIKPYELENYIKQGFMKGKLKCQNKV